MDLRILADDLTGALDTAAAFDGEVPVFFDRPDPEAAAPVSAVATGTRDIAAAELPARLAPALAWLAGAGIAFKKVDSLLRGNTVAEVLLAARAGGFDRIVFAPAFPRQGRLMVDGRLVLASDAAGTLRPSVRESLAGAGIAVEVPDMRNDADLQAVADRVRAQGAQRWLWCGSAGLAHALARALGLAARLPAAMAGAGRKPLLLVSASHQAVSRRQWALLRAAQAQAALLVREGDAAQLRAALAAMRSPFEAALLDLAPLAPLSAEAAAALLAEQLAAIAQQAPRPGVLAVVGGDTLLGLCRATGARGLLASAALRAGWGQARWIGGPWDGVLCHSRSGAFGGERDLVEAVAALRG